MYKSRSWEDARQNAMMKRNKPASSPPFHHTATHDVPRHHVPTHSHQHFLLLSSRQEGSSFLGVLRLGGLPLVDDLLLSGCASRLERHLEGIGLDDEEGVGLVGGDLDFLSSPGVNLSLHVEGPEEGAARDDRLVAGDGLAEALALTPAEGGHAHDGGKLGEVGLVGGPAGFEPALGAEVPWVGVFDGVVEEGVVEGEDASALGDEVAFVPVVFFELVGDTWRDISVYLLV